MKQLCLLGTWNGSTLAEADRIRAAISQNGAWASWWSFPIREEFLPELRQPFDVYLNTGGARVTYRMRVVDLRTSRGNDGMVSPWPDLTDSNLVGQTRAGQLTSEIFKTWFRVTALDGVQPALSLDDFDAAPGVSRAALLNQSTFGYAYRRSTETAALSIGQPPVNLILYGPPGTGKTHWLQKQLSKYTDTPNATDENAWLQEVLAHFGWRPVIAVVLDGLGGTARVPQIREHKWLRAKAQQRGRTTGSVHQTIWGYLQEHTPESVETVKAAIRRPPFIFTKHESGEWSLLPDWAETDEESTELRRVLQAGPAKAAGPIRRYELVTFHPSFTYEDFVRGIRPVTAGDDSTSQFRMVDGVFKAICDQARANPGKRYALFIDEINRANIAKVFGELITLIEIDKRGVFDETGLMIGGLAVRLPGNADEDSPDPLFSVPANLDVYGTMNTADKSIALLDVALRRRFDFREMEPDYGVIDRKVGEVHLGQLLNRLNDRLEFLLDRDHRVGHAYLMSVTSLADLQQTFRTKIVPLMQEFFFDDLSRVELVLGTTASAPPVVFRRRVRQNEIFNRAGSESLPGERFTFAITESSSWTEATFVGMYSSDPGTAPTEMESD